MAEAERDWPAQVLRCLTEAGHQQPRIVERTLLDGGFSRSTWRLAVEADGGTLDLVASVSDAHGAVRRGESLPRDAEGRLLRSLAAAGAPVPAVHGAVEDGDGGLVLMDRVAGETRVRPALKDPGYAGRQADLARSLARSLVRIHRAVVPAEAVGWEPVDPGDCSELARRRWRASATAMGPGPRRDTLLEALDHLDRWDVPPPPAVVVVHGDFRLGNVAYSPRGIEAVLDWEMAHPGDPVEDVAWPLLPTFRFGTPLACGLVPDDRWLEEYRRAGGWPVHEDALRFWVALGLVKMTCLNQRSLDRAPDEEARRILDRQARDLLAGLDAALATGPTARRPAGRGSGAQIGGRSR